MMSRTLPKTLTDYITDQGRDAKDAWRTLYRAARYLQLDLGTQYWYNKSTQEPVVMLFTLASNLRKGYGLVYPD